MGNLNRFYTDHKSLCKYVGAILLLAIVLTLALLCWPKSVEGQEVITPVPPDSG